MKCIRTCLNMKVCSHAASKVLRCFIFSSFLCVFVFVFLNCFFFFEFFSVLRGFFFFRFHLFPNCKLVAIHGQNYFIQLQVCFSQYEICNIITSYEILNVTALHSAALQSLTNTLIRELLMQTCAFCLGYTF